MESNVIVIAKKEFFDHIRSKKFLLIFGIFLVIAIVGIMDGVSSYNNAIQSYSERQHQISLSDIPVADIPQFLGSPPSIMIIFNMMSMTMITMGAILGIAMGFDLLTKEKESKSLKILLAHPVYRDEVINGKAIGGIIALALALVIMLVLSIAILLIFGIIPEGVELVLLALFGVTSFVYIFTFFAIALFVSTVSEESGIALIYTMIIYIALTLLIPILMSSAVMNVLSGPPPEMPKSFSDQLIVPSGGTTGLASSNSGTFPGEVSEKPSPEMEDFQKKVEQYTKRQSAILDIFYMLTPNMNYDKIAMAITMPQLTNKIFGSRESSSTSVSSEGGFRSSSANAGISLSDSLGLVWKNIIALLIFPSVFFGLAYVSFMRLDIR